jgi:hypothetical protein
MTLSRSQGMRALFARRRSNSEPYPKFFHAYLLGSRASVWRRVKYIAQWDIMHLKKPELFVSQLRHNPLNSLSE